MQINVSGEKETQEAGRTATFQWWGQEVLPGCHPALIPPSTTAYSRTFMDIFKKAETLHGGYTINGFFIKK